MQLTALSDTSLEITDDQVESLFAPFVGRRFGKDDPDWRREIARRKRKIARTVIRRSLFGWLPANQRTKTTVLNEYSRAWDKIGYRQYDLTEPPAKWTPWEWRGESMFASDVGATRVRQLLLIRMIERLQPKRVLEVGCGNGINLLLLAGRFPDIGFAGVELTEAGHRAATMLQEEPALPRSMQDYAPLPLVDPAAFRRIAFTQGDATALPYDDGSFDLVFTVLALEQMERVRAQALAEVARVSGGHTLMIEPFADVNQALWPKLNVQRRNYFRGRIDDLRGHGLEPTLAIADFPQESFLKACAVLAEKRA